MEKIAVLVDTASDIDLDLAKKEGIYLLPLYVNLGGKYLKDREEISPDEFYNWIKETKTQAKTSAASPTDAINLYEQIKEDGYEKVIAISINSNFSSTFSLLNMTVIDDLETYVFDTGNLTMSEGFFALYAKELIDQDYSFDKVVAKLEEKKQDSRVFFSIESFKYITEGGRFPKALSKVGDALSVKPIISVDPMEGAFKLIKLARGERRLIKEFSKIALEELKHTKDYYFFIGHGGYEEGLCKLEDIFKDVIAGAKQYFNVQISPTLGANTGPGLFGFGIFKLD